MHRPGGRSRNSSLIRDRWPLFLVAAGVLAIAVGVAAIFFVSGGDDDDTPAGANGNGAGQYTAETLLPEIADLGLRQTDKQADEAATRLGQDTWRALYSGGAGIASVQVYTTVLKSTKDAETQFNGLATALRNPPEEFVGAGVPQADTTPTAAGANAKAYVTSKPDQNNQYVWTDIYRFDRAVVIVQVLGRQSDEIAKTRLAIAQRIEQATK